MSKSITKGPLLLAMFVIIAWALSTSDIQWTTDMVMITLIVSVLIIALIVYLLKTGRVRVKS